VAIFGALMRVRVCLAMAVNSYFISREDDDSDGRLFTQDD
jgi:hypothetical protein